AQSSSGGKAGTAGTTGTGGTGAGGRTGTGGTTPTTPTGGATGTGGTPGVGGSTPGLGGMIGACDPGTTTTAWATSCPTAPATTCVAGTWTAVGPDSGNTDATLVAESAHFAVYSNGAITAAQGMAATDA